MLPLKCKTQAPIQLSSNDTVQETIERDARAPRLRCIPEGERLDALAACVRLVDAREPIPAIVLEPNMREYLYKIGCHFEP